MSYNNPTYQMDGILFKNANNKKIRGSKKFSIGQKGIIKRVKKNDNLVQILKNDDKLVKQM